MMRTNQQGSIFLVLFSAVAIMGLLGVGLTSFIRGPMTSAVKMTRNNTAQTQMMLAAQSAVMGAASLGTNGDCDADGYVEPVEWRLASGATPKPTGGNLIPTNIGAPVLDPWGSDYGYCAWDHGATTLNGVCQLNSPGTNARLAGTNSRKYPAVAIISAGPDKTFDTTCRSFTAADVNTNGTLGDSVDYELVQKNNVTNDDVIFIYTYEEATAASGGLWSLKSSGAATVSKNIEAPQAKFTGTSMLTSIGGVPLASSEANVAMLSGLRLADDTQMVTCNPANAGVLRRLSASMAVQMCDGTTWVTQGGSSGGSSTYLDDLSDAIVNYMRGNMLAGTTSGSITSVNAGMGNTLMSAGGAVITLTNGMGNTGLGTATFSGLTSGDNNTALGDSALWRNVSGNNNTAVGSNALAGSVNQNVNDSTAIGIDTLKNATGGVTGLTAFGMQAGRNVTSSSVGATLYGTYVGDNTNLGSGNTGIGDTVFNAATGASNTGVGTYTFYDLTTGNRNVAIGNGAGSQITTSSDVTAIGPGSLGGLRATTASGNHTAVGLWSMGSVNGTIANSNTGVGSSVMYNNTTGGGNVAIGGNALHDNTTTYFNTAIGGGASGGKRETGATAFGDQSNVGSGTGGYGSMFGHYSGLYNAPRGVGFGIGTLSNNGNASNYPVGIGYYAVGHLGSGLGNTGVGSRAADGVTSATSVTAVGYQALINANAAANTALGYRANRELSTGANNVTVGYEALQGAYNAAANTAIGHSAMYNNSTGGNNVAVGYSALRGISSHTGNVALGESAAYNVNAGNDNVYVGSRAGMGNGSGGPSSSVLVGYAAGFGIQSGAAWTAFGAEALGTNVTTANNSAFGAYAASKVTAAANSAAGYRALARSGSGANNTVAGAGALTNSTAAANSDALGFMALSASGVDSLGSSAAGAYALAKLYTNNSLNVAVGYKALFNTSTAVQAVGIGALANSTGNFTNSTGIGYNALPTANNTIRFGDANVTKIEGQVAWTAPSDKRLKKDITPTDLGLDFIMGLKPVSYRMINGNGRLDYGFLAQDIEASLDGRVTNMLTQLDDKMKTYQLRSNDLKAPIVKAIQEQQIKIEKLKQEIAALKNEPVNCEEAR